MINLKRDIALLSKEGVYNAKKSYMDIIVSPYYYWSFERKLPIKSLKRAKKMLPQMVHSLLPDKKFTFVTIQQKEDKHKFYLFAVDIDLIKEKLALFHVDYKLMSNISFVHLEFEDIAIELNSSFIVKDREYAFEISKDRYTLNNDEVQEVTNLLARKKELNYKYKLGNGSLVYKMIDFVDNSFISLALIALLLLAGVSITSFWKHKVIQKYENKSKLLLSNQKYVTHQIQLKYLMNNLLDLDAKQKSFRRELNAILSIKANQKSFLESLEYDDSYWFIKIQAPAKEQADNLMSGKKFKFITQESNHFTYEKNR